MALAATILANIKADPRISSKDIEVRYVPAESANRSEAIAIGGTAASADEHIAVRNHVYKMTNMGLNGSLNVIERAPDPTPPLAWTGPQAGEPLVPLCEGLTVVTAIASQGDYESIKTVESITDDAVRLKYSNQPNPPWWSPFHSKTPSAVTLHRTVLKADLETARRYHQIFVTTNRVPESAPGATAIGTSAAVLRDLKTKGRAELSLCSSADDTEVRDDKGNVRRPGAGCLDYSDPLALTRVGASPVRMRLLVNGTPTELPAVHAKGNDAARVEFFFLDDERNPLTLAFRLGIGTVPALRPINQGLCDAARRGEGGFIMTGEPPPSCDLPDGGDRDTLRVVSISTRCNVPTLASGATGDGAPAGIGGGALPTGRGAGEGVGAGSGAGAGAGAGGGAGASAGGGGAAAVGARAIEAALAERGTLDIYSIYFAFNSDVLREESGPTLEDIAAVLRRNPGWKLRVNGHTDGIGTDAFNLDLSRRRAAAVKAALVTRHGIDGRRLDTSGAGESQPKDSNETLEGRARNRRVELMKSS